MKLWYICNILRNLIIIISFCILTKKIKPIIYLKSIKNTVNLYFHFLCEMKSKMKNHATLDTRKINAEEQLLKSK